MARRADEVKVADEWEGDSRLMLAIAGTNRDDDCGNAMAGKGPAGMTTPILNRRGPAIREHSTPQGAPRMPRVRAALPQSSPGLWVQLFPCNCGLP